MEGFSNCIEQIGLDRNLQKKMKKRLLFIGTSGNINMLGFWADSCSAVEIKYGNMKEVQIMAKCDICGKGVTFGIKVSHSHRRSNRAWKPNVRRVKAVIDGKPCRVYACTRCLRSDKVTRAQ